MSLLASIHDRICFKRNQSLVLGLGLVAVLQAFFTVIAYIHNGTIKPLGTFEWVALPVALIFLAVILGSARCLSEKIVSALFACGAAVDFLAGGPAIYWQLSSITVHYRLANMMIWIATALSSLAALFRVFRQGRG